MNNRVQFRIPHLVLFGLAVCAVMLLMKIWGMGWVVARDGWVQVRKVPLPENGIAIPGASEYCYVIETGRFPYHSTFRVQWDSYQAKRITIEPSSDSKPYFRVVFDNGYAVSGRVSGPGDLSVAEWEMHASDQEPDMAKKRVQ